MPLDSSIPLQVKGISLADIARDAEALRSAQQQRQVRDWQFQQMQDKASRETRARGSLADLLHADPNASPFAQVPSSTSLANTGRPTPMSFDQAFSPQTMATFQAGGTPQPAYEKGTVDDPSVPDTSSIIHGPNPDLQARWDRFVDDDPEGAMEYRKHMQAFSAEQFKQAHNLNNAVLGILSGVVDQGTYDQAKVRARNLYGRLGVNIDDFGLPDEYSPQVVQSLRMQALSGKDQLIQAQRQQKLDADIADDEADNDRQDRNLDSMVADRNARRAEARRYHDQRDATTRRGQDFRTRDTQRGQDITASRPRGGKAGGGAVTATGPGGVQIHYDAGKRTWVDAKGNPVQ